MSVITISREFGSMGTEVAERAARALGYAFADKTTIGAILRDYGLGNFEEEYRSLPGFWDHLDLQRMKLRALTLSMLNHCLQALARHGEVVIVGRGGFAVLGGLADVLNVRIQAPQEVRARRLVEAPAIGDPGLAERVVPENDHLQKTFIKSVYGLDWDSTKGFDLVIDTAKVTPSLAADLVVQTTRALRVPATSGVATAAGLEVDPILAEAVEEELQRQLAPAG
jgi:hypothetical protein